MPELPEVERVRLTLLPRLIGRRVMSVQVRREEVVTHDGPRVAGRSLQPALLQGLIITSLHRHGKQLAIAAGESSQALDDQRALVVHLGMTGSLISAQPRNDDAIDKHDHLIWLLDDGSRLTFNDPRRFGGVWTFNSFAEVRQRWAALGEDALAASAPTLNSKLKRTRRNLKAALLDQSVIAGLGNIYVDELLFRCGLHPKRRADRIDAAVVACLCDEIKSLLAEAIARGGSTLRNYVDGDGHGGAFQERHQVYGRAGLPCLRCGQPLATAAIGGRTTVYCKRCQCYRGEPRARAATGKQQ